MSATTQAVVRDNQLQGVEHRARKATPGAFGAPRDIEAVRRQIREELASSMRSDARLAAMIILIEPERIGKERIGEFLLRIKCIEFETVSGWLQAAGVNPWRTGLQLSPEHRRALARQLIAFWKAGEQR